ncbi:hypothetical protein ACVR1G_06040 [Streptococcus dentasini]
MSHKTTLSSLDRFTELTPAESAAITGGGNWFTNWFKSYRPQKATVTVFKMKD